MIEFRLWAFGLVVHTTFIQLWKQKGLIITVAEKDTAAAAKAAVGQPKATVGRQRATHQLRLAAAAHPRPPICLKIDSLAYDWLTIIPHACTRGQFVGLHRPHDTWARWILTAIKYSKETDSASFDTS